jgi:hypothetical protein
VTGNLLAPAQLATLTLATKNHGVTRVEEARCNTPCAWCARRCHRAAVGARWRVEWSLGEGPAQGLELQGSLSECEAGARVPLAAWPGSSWSLVEVRPDGEVAWLRFDDRELARTRLALLRAVAQLTSLGSLPGTTKAWRILLARQRRELSRPSPDAFMCALQSVDGVLDLQRRAELRAARASAGSPEHAAHCVFSAQANSTLERLACAVSDHLAVHAAALSEAWQRIDASLAVEFRAVASLARSARHHRLSRHCCHDIRTSTPP